ncbi:MAG: RNA polymerase sigma factor [Bacteroidota bacterium]
MKRISLIGEPFSKTSVHTMITMGKPDKIVDSLLVISYKAGDSKAMDLLVRRWNGKLCAHAFRYVKDWSLAKDITQEVWGSILRKIHLLRDSNSFGSWAMTITSRKALDVLSKHKKRKKDVPDSFWDTQMSQEEIDVSKEGKMNKIKAAMAALTFEQKMVLKLFYLEEYSLKEISKITNASVNTVKTRLFRAREKIKVELKKKNDEA